MKIRAAIIVGALLLFPAGALGQPHLVVEPLSGEAPLIVRIAGPTLALTKIAECRFGWFPWIGAGGNGLWVDWGDGSEVFSLEEMYGPVRDSCADRQRKHIYRVPGTYRISVEAWHPGPIDAPVTEWKGEATVTVTGEGQPDSLAIVAPFDQRTYFYQRFPSVRWRSSVREPSTMWVEIINDGGAVLSSQHFDWASVGERDVSPIVRPEEGYDHALRDGEASAFVRVSLIRAGKVLFSRDSLPQRLSARIEDNYFFIPFRDDAAGSYTATVRVNLLTDKSGRGRIEWGDGEITDLAGPLDNLNNVFAHTYTQAGVYHIKLRRKYSGGPPDIDDVVGYYAVDVRIPRTRVDRWPDTKR